MRAHVVRRQKQVRNGGGRLGAQRPGVDQVHQQRLGVPQEARARRIVLDVRVEEPGVQVLVAQQFLADIDRALELPPGLAHHLFARALHGGASVRPRRRPVGDIDREDAAHVAVAELLGRHAAPELELRDARERPFGVDVNHVAVRRGHVAVQIELHAVHPLHVRGQRAQVGERRVGGEQAAVHQGGHALERERGHVVVAMHHGALAVAGERRRR